MFSGRWDSSLTFDDQGAVFMDTSPPVFEATLSHLRALSLDPHAKPPEVAPSLRPEVAAFRKFMMLGDAAGVAAIELKDYIVVEVNAKVQCDDVPWMVNPTVERAQRMLRPHTGASASAAIVFDHGGRLVIRFTDPCVVSGIKLKTCTPPNNLRLKLHGGVFSDLTAKCDVTCGTAVFCRGDLELAVSPRTHTLNSGGQYRVEREDILIVTFSTDGWRVFLQELSFF
eukprot:NODE_2707_length_890_cov_357.699401.p1 GENE.NODE_2707_length_890_cov_357.699401~~NODE_2707_length_890_cov_357.699401.p1  ORF type:complete len:241 (+),score=50.84 NODE_2707_length_890_cov_357.699401:45-725(+)